MSKSVKVVIWLLGAIVLILLMQYPTETSINSTEFLNLPLTNKVIVLDPGHGGVDGGAVGDGDTLEKDIALMVSQDLRDYLQQAGAVVYLTRETDKDLAAQETKGLSRRKVEDLRNRIAFVEEKDPDLFISIHLNALPSSQWRGAQTFYHPNRSDSKVLAESIQSEIVTGLGNTNRDALAVNSIYILKYAHRPSALVEIGFLSNPEERALLKTPEYQDQMAASIYHGILNYFASSEQ